MYLVLSPVPLPSLCLSTMLARLSFKWRRLLVSTPSSHSWRLRLLLGQSELGAVKRLHSQLVNAATHLCLPLCVCVSLSMCRSYVCVWVCAILLEQLQHCSHHVCHFYNYFCYEYLLVNCVRAPFTLHPPPFPTPHMYATFACIYICMPAYSCFSPLHTPLPCNTFAQLHPFLSAFVPCACCLVSLLLYS